MSECINWPVLITIICATFGLFFIALLVAWLLTPTPKRHRHCALGERAGPAHGLGDRAINQRLPIEP